MGDKKYIDKWGAIPITQIREGKFKDLIYPGDYRAIVQIQQPIVEIIGKNGGYLIIKSGNSVCRISPSIVQDCKKPKFFVNDNVKFYNTKGYIEFGVIKDLYWHINNNQYIYIIEVNGKIKSKRYCDKDLEKVE